LLGATFTVLAVAAFLIVSASATAGAAVAITYSAPASCPSAAQFIGLVETDETGETGETGRKNGGGDPNNDGGARPVFLVEIVNTPAGTEGRVRRQIGSQLTEPRVFSDAHCGPVAEALALTVRLSLAAEAEATSKPAVVNKAPEAALVRSSPRAPVATASPWAVGGGITASGLLPPQPLTGVALFVEHRPVPSTPSSPPSPPSALALRAPELRLTLSLARNNVLRDPGSAEFSLLVATVDACPLGVNVASHLGARLCAFGEAGAIQGKGITVDNPRTARSFWSAGGLLARLRLAPTSMSGTFLEIQGGAVLPLHQIDYFFEMPRIPVAAGPMVTWTAALTTGLTIP
jgi:hypothetical protein